MKSRDMQIAEAVQYSIAQYIEDSFDFCGDELLLAEAVKNLDLSTIIARVPKPKMETESATILELLARLEEEKSNAARFKCACSKMNEEISQILGKALGYPYLCEDRKNFPDAVESDGVCVGDHVAESLAMEAADRLEAAERDAKRYRFIRSIDQNKLFTVNTNERINRPFPEELDAAIDAAMQQEAVG